MPDRTSFDLSRLLAALRKSWPLILVITLVAAFAGYVVSWRQPDSYQATAKLLFRAEDPVPQIDPNVPPPENPNSPDTIAATNLQLADAEADDAAVEVKRRLRSPLDPAELRGRLTLAPEGQTELITVTGTGDTGREAASIANAFSEVIVDARRREAQRRVERVIQAIDASLTAPGVTPAAAQTLQARMEQLQTERRLQTGDVSVGVPATVPGSPSAPRPMRSALLGGFLGLLIGVGLALWLARYDRRLTDAEIEEIVGAEIVARIPNGLGLGARPPPLPRGVPVPAREPPAALRAAAVGRAGVRDHEPGPQQRQDRGGGRALQGARLERLPRRGRRLRPAAPGAP